MAAMVKVTGYMRETDAAGVPTGEFRVVPAPPPCSHMTVVDDGKAFLMAPEQVLVHFFGEFMPIDMLRRVTTFSDAGMADQFGVELDFSERQVWTFPDVFIAVGEQHAMDHGYFVTEPYLFGDDTIPEVPDTIEGLIED